MKQKTKGKTDEKGKINGVPLVDEGEKIHRLLEHVLHYGSFDPDDKKNVDELVKIGDSAIPSIMGALINNNKTAYTLLNDPSETLIWILKEINSEKSIDALVSLLYGKNLELRRNAVLALANIETPKVMYTLALASRNNEDEYTRKHAGKALEKIMGKIPEQKVNELIEKGIDTLIGNLKDDDPEVKHRATVALGTINCSKVEKETVEKIVEVLVGVLKDENLEVRKSAVLALGKMDYSNAKKETIEEVVDLLVGVLKNNHEAPIIRENVAAVLGNMDYFKFEKKLVERVVNDLIGALEDEDQNVKFGIVLALGKMEYSNVVEKVIDTLLEILEKEEPNVKFGIVLALGKMEYSNVEKETISRVINALFKALKDESESVKRKTVVSLGEIAQKIELEKLVGIIHSAEFFKLAENAQMYPQIFGKMQERMKKSEANEAEN